MSSRDLQSSRQIWTEYWRGGRRGCLTDEASASARDHIASLWRNWFRQLPSGARILDLACGAGEVARTALSLGAETQLDFDIEGVDLAELDEVVQAPASGTRLHLQGGIDIARLPFSDRSFDCAVSQFGVEYTDKNATCAELARVSKAGAVGLFLLHHRESEISAAAQARLRAFAAVVDNAPLFDCARQVYEAIGARAAEQVVRSRLAKFRQRLDVARKSSDAFAWESNLREILGFLDDLARNPRRYDPFDAIRHLDGARWMIGAWKSRQESQLSAALDENGIAAFAELLRSSGLKPSEPELLRDPATGMLVAWQLAFNKTAT